jgi:hypothetical protein
MSDNVKDVPGWEQYKRILNEDCDNLSDWETSFLDSIERQLKQGRYLSEAQQEILAKIERKVNR